MSVNASKAERAAEGPRATAPKPAARRPRAPARARSAVWIVIGLLVLGGLPLVPGALRLFQLAGSTAGMPPEARFDAAPLPVVLHIVAAAGYTLLGALQFAPGFRRRRPGWHRLSGWLVVGCGLVVALSALWMTLFYPGANGASALLFWARLAFGSAMVGAIVCGVNAIRRDATQRHRAWMARAYAIGLGAGTQMLALLAGELIAGPPSDFGRALLMTAAWIINLLVAEWGIRRRAPHMRAARVV